MKSKLAKIPVAQGPYSPFVRTGKLVFCSGQIGIDPKTNELTLGIEKQTHRVLENLSSVLKQAGTNLENVVKTTIYLTSVKDYTLVNDIYGSYFIKKKPARTTVEVSNLPKGALIEIDAIATIK